MTLQFSWPRNTHPHHVTYRWRLQTDTGATTQEGETKATSVEVTVPEVSGRVGYRMVVEWLHARSGKWTAHHTTELQWVDAPEPEPEPVPEPEPDSEPQPVPDGPHPAVPHIDHDPVVRPPENIVVHTHPQAFELTALRYRTRDAPFTMVVVVTDAMGQEFVAVKLPDGRIGLWGVEAVLADANGAEAMLSSEGPWIHVGDTAKVTAEIGEPAELEDRVEGPYEWFAEVLPYHELPDWSTFGFVHHIRIWVEGWTAPEEEPPEPAPAPEPDPDPAEDDEPQAADLPAPGQPQFEATADGGIVSWTHSEGADNYRVRWRGSDVLTPESPVEIAGLQLGDWVCVHPRIGEEEGPDYRCNTWTDGG